MRRLCLALLVVFLCAVAVVKRSEFFENMNDRHQQILNEIGRMQDENPLLEAEIEKLKPPLDKLIKLVKQKEDEFQDISAVNKVERETQFVQKQSEQREKITECKQRLQKVNSKLGELEKKIGNARGRSMEINEKIKVCEDQKKNAMEEAKEVEKEIEDANEKANEASSELADANNEKNKALNDRQKALTEVNNRRALKKLPRIYI